jgi:hypothetical protein
VTDRSPRQRLDVNDDVGQFRHDGKANHYLP